MIEKIIFNLLAFAIFIIVFGRFIKKNDTSYVYILALEFIGIVINFIELLSNVTFNIFLKIIMYILAIVIPGIMLLIEYKTKTDFPEMLNIILAKIALHSGNTEKAKDYLFKLINKYPESYVGHKTLAEVYEKEENDLIKNFINKNILQGQTNIRLFADKPLDRSTYYKYKNKFVDIIYHCCISKGFVTLEEILEEKIA